MSQYYTQDSMTKEKSVKKSDVQKNLAGEFLAEKGYSRQAKPREVNAGRDRLPENYTKKNKARLNRDLAAAPAVAKSENAPIARSTKPKVKKKKASEVARISVTEVRREKPATPFPLSAILCVIAITVISLYVIHLYIELDELNALLSDYNNQIAEMKNEERVLQSKKASKYNLEEIERIAKEKYGMVDADQLPKEYITPETDDSIEIMETSTDVETPGALLSGFAGVVSNLLSYIN